MNNRTYSETPPDRRLRLIDSASGSTGVQSSLVSLEETMTTNRNRRLPTDDIQANRQALSGIQLLSDYAPANKTYSAANLGELGRAMEEAQQAELRAMQALAITRDLAAAA